MQRRLRILFLANRCPLPIVDGQSRRTYNILKGLARRHDVSLLSLYDPDVKVDPGTIQHLESFCARVELFAGPAKRVSFPMAMLLLASLFSRDPYTIWRHYSPAYRKRVYELAHSGKYDLVHCDIISLAYAIRNVNGIPCSITDHDVSYLVAQRMAKNAANPLMKAFVSWESIKLKRLEARILERATVGIAVSEVDRKMLQALCPEANLVVIENGVDTTEFAPSPEEPDDHSLVWIGGFNYYPNREGMQYFFEKVYPLIKREIPGVTITVVGNGVTAQLRRWASEDSSIQLLGFVENPIPYAQKAAVFVAPILSGSGTRLKLLEAMALGKAIVTTTIGCEGIEGMNGKDFLIGDQPAQFAAKVVDLLRNRNLRDQLGRNARKVVSDKYDWNMICEKMSRTYLAAS